MHLSVLYSVLKLEPWHATSYHGLELLRNERRCGNFKPFVLNNMHYNSCIEFFDDENCLEYACTIISVYV